MNTPFSFENLVLKQKKKIVSFDIAKRFFAVQTFGFFLSQDCLRLKQKQPHKKIERLEIRRISFSLFLVSVACDQNE